jgi:hypothetical protein
VQKTPPKKGYHLIFVVNFGVKKVHYKKYSKKKKKNTMKRVWEWARTGVGKAGWREDG